MWMPPMFSGCKRGRNCEYIKPNTAAAKTGHKWTILENLQLGKIWLTRDCCISYNKITTCIPTLP
jgi:hypothetical protein